MLDDFVEEFSSDPFYLLRKGLSRWRNNYWPTHCEISQFRILIGQYEILKPAYLNSYSRNGTLSELLISFIFPKSTLSSLPFSYTPCALKKLSTSRSTIKPVLAESIRWNKEAGVKSYSSASISLTISSLRSTYALRVRKSSNFCLVWEERAFNGLL